MSKKSIIAKLLSEEDISVVHKKTKTAAFNVETRELILPLWKEEMSKDISDLFICHEIGHALYTSKDLLTKMIERKIDKSYVNIIEDARIEKMVQDKYLGTRSCFTKGYKELISKDFFGVDNKDLNELNLADRINLHFKGMDNVPFSSVEQTWVDKVANVKTEDEVLDIAQGLMDFTDKNEESQNQEQEQQSQSSVGSDEGEGENQESGSDDNSDDSSDDTQSQGSNNDGDEGQEETQSSSSEESDDDKNTEEKKTEVNSGFQGGEGYKHTATTDLSFDKSLDDAMDKNAKDRVYATIPKVNDKVIIDYKSILEQCKKHYDKTENSSKFISKTKSDMIKFQMDSKKVVSYMVKEFEMKKSADLYKRASVSKTGTLNMGALHTYQFNEDLFAKVTTLPGATNHGLVMFFDWSGSMQYNLTQTLKQLYNLVWFCDRVKIPYKVYAFSDAYVRPASYAGIDSESVKVTQNPDNKSDLDVSGFRLIEMFSDKMRKNETADMMHYWYMMGCYYAGYRDWSNAGYPVSPPYRLQLGGTPLNHAIVAAMSIIPKFKNDNGIQKVNAVFLTDGVSHKANRKISGENLGGYNTDDYITDKVTNTTVTSENKGRYYSGEKQTTMLLELLKKRIPESNVLGFFVAGSGKTGIVRREIIQDKMGLHWDDMDTLKKCQKELRTNKVLVCKTAGYDEYYILPSIPKVDENDEDGIQVKENAKTGDLKRAFAKFSKSKVLNRQLLNKFIAQVA
jgi:hypothetical protein